MSAKLLPCPFCGSNNVHSDTDCRSGFVECLEDDCWAMMRGKTEKHAVIMWNRRRTKEAAATNRQQTKCGAKPKS